MAAINEHLTRYSDPEDAEEHKDELKVTMANFDEAFQKVKTSSYQKATIYWDSQRNAPSTNII
jgi:hypothetical protein